MNHQQILEILPWYANATLEEKERRAVEAHLVTCASCARELEGLKSLRSAVAELAEEVPPPSAAGLAQALSRIEAYERERARKRQSRFGAIRGLTDRLMAPLVAWWQPLPAPARVLVAAQFLLVALLAGILASRPSEGRFEVAGSTPGVQNARPRILVRFHEQIPEETMRKTIQSFRGDIVSGPSPGGYYTIAVPIPPERAGEIEKLLADLRRQPDIIRFAEPR